MSSQNAGKVNKCHIQLIDEKGQFNVEELEIFGKEVGMKKWGISYAVVSIMGKQSSGKSTLLNHLFGTDFTVLTTSQRHRTTEGIWMAKCAGIEPCTLVMDLEGSDGKERGEVTDFEKKAALFALYVSDIMLINMHCGDIGCHQGSSTPLLTTVFEVAMALFENFSSRKRTLMFVIRDKTKAPSGISESKHITSLDCQLRDLIQEIWDSVPKPAANKGTPLREFFNVKVEFLSHYDFQEAEFTKEVDRLKMQFVRSTEPGKLAGDRRSVTPASSFAFDAREIWEKIKANRALNLPDHKVMVATVYCDEISKHKFQCFAEDKDWHFVNKNLKVDSIPKLGRMINSLIYKYLSEYDAETSNYDHRIRSEKRNVLERNLIEIVQPVWQIMLRDIAHGVLQNFKEKFEKILCGTQQSSMDIETCIRSSLDLFDKESEGIEATHWVTSEAKQKLMEDICAYALLVLRERSSRSAPANNARDVIAPTINLASVLAGLTTGVLGLLNS